MEGHGTARRGSRLRDEYKNLQGFWAGRAREKGILTERDLQHYLSSTTRLGRNTRK